MERGGGRGITQEMEERHFTRATIGCFTEETMLQDESESKKDPLAVKLQRQYACESQRANEKFQNR